MINEEIESQSLEEKKRKKKRKVKKKKGKKDACYHKVRSRYDVWPSAYASATGNHRCAGRCINRLHAAELEGNPL